MDGRTLAVEKPEDIVTTRFDVFSANIFSILSVFFVSVVNIKFKTRFVINKGAVDWHADKNRVKKNIMLATSCSINRCW